MTTATPLRFVAGVVGLWAAARVVVLTPDLLIAPVEADPPSTATNAASATDPATRPAIARGAVATNRSPVVASSFAMMNPAPRAMNESRRAGHGESSRPARVIPAATRAIGRPGPLLSPTGLVVCPADDPGADARVTGGVGGATVMARADGVAAALPEGTAAPSRLSGGVYLYRRGEGGAPPLATGGQLGGSQAGARVAWALGPAETARVALAARLATPLDDARGAEAAAGIDLRPLPGRPLRVSIERRIDLGGGARDAWSAYAAGGFWRPLGHGLAADGYAQAGVVGARRRDLFADGAIRLGHRRELGHGRALTLGGGAWGAAQPGVARFDVGPRAALSLPVGGTTVTAAAEWRMRVAGGARPGSGLALTLASDF